MRRSIWALSLVLLLGAGRAAAQEVQVPLDEAGRVERVDRRLAERLGMWTAEYPGFQEARLFQAADSSFVLEISVLRDGRLVRERLPRAAGEVALLRRQVQAELDRTANLNTGGALNQEGRYLLLGQTTLAGVFFYGWALPEVVDADGEGGAGLYLLTAATSFFAPFALTQNRPVTYGMANLSRYGVSRGIFHGVLLHNLVRGAEDDPFDECIPDAPCEVVDQRDDFERGRLAGGLVASVAEGVGGYLWARNERMSPGTANAIAAGGDLGLFWGLGTALIAGTEDIGERSTAAIALPAAAAGILAGHRLAKRRDYTWGDVDLLYTGGMVGALGGLAVADLVGNAESEKGMWGAAMVGSAIGAVVADGLVRNTDFSVGQASLNRLGAAAGALAGASLGVMAEEATVALTGAALGGAAGYALTYLALADEAPAGRGERMPSSAWELRIQPQGLINAALGPGAERELASLFSVRYRFGGR